jgi:toxin ParE1/3/4
VTVRCLSVLPSALADIRQQRDYLLEESPAAAHRFVSAVNEAVEGLPAFPFSGAPQEHRGAAFEGIRAKAVPGFPAHYVFYRVTDETIEVLRILHTARDPEGLFEV